MSVVGTVVSFLGGATIGLSFAVTLLIQSSACRQNSLSLVGELVAWGFVAGGLGSLVRGCDILYLSGFERGVWNQLDSLMGATIQRTRYSKSSKKILQDDTVAGPEAEVTVVSGLNLLTNGQVCAFHEFTGGYSLMPLASVGQPDIFRLDGCFDCRAFLSDRMKSRALFI